VTLAYELNLALTEAMAGEEFPEETPGEFLADKVDEVLSDEAVIREVTSLLRERGRLLEYEQVAEVIEALVDVLEVGLPNGSGA